MIYTILAIIVLVLTLILVALVIVARTGSKKSSSEGGEKRTLKLPNFDVYKTIKFIAIIVLYILLMWVIKDSFPQLWFWISQKGSLFWAIQGIAVSALIFLYLSSQKTKVFIVILALIFSGVYLWSLFFAEKEVFYPEIPQEEIDEFLRNTEPPEELKAREARGEIWDLKLIWSGEVGMDEWSPVIKLSTPPRGQYYRTDTFVLSGQVIIKANDRVAGKYPSDTFRPVRSIGNLFFTFKSADHPKTAIQVWFWKQSHP